MNHKHVKQAWFTLRNVTLCYEVDTTNLNNILNWHYAFIWVINDDSGLEKLGVLGGTTSK